jgi:DNA repair protein RadC
MTTGRDVEYRPTIKQLPAGERPRERLLQQGPGALSSAELIAILLRTGTRDENAVQQAQRLIGLYNGLPGLAQAPVSELAQIKGVGPVKAVTLRAALELGRRWQVASPADRPQICSPADAAQLLMLEMGPMEQEHLRALLLDTKNRVLKIDTVAIGSLNSASVRVGEMFREAIRLNCAAVIVAHNHPSGDPTPSAEDVHVTRQMVEAGKLLDIPVLDHLVIGQQRWVSLKERGLGF